MPMTNEQLTALLDRLMVGGESEVVEFKEASKQYSKDKIAEYVSALSNEANLRNLPSAWLVFGISDKRQVVGTAFLSEEGERQDLKHRIHQAIDQGVTLREIHEVHHSGKRVLLLETPAAPRGIPISCKGDYRARAGESLVALSLEKLDEIRRQNANEDWTAVVIPEATLGHLDPAAIARARQGFAERHASRISAEEIESWDDATFLEKTRLSRSGQLTRAAILLLGSDTSFHLISPHPALLTWKLDGEEQAYEHFYTPFILTASELASRIRNVRIRLLPPNELIYREITKYDHRSILEALYNAIAHQDYRKNARIIVTERIDRLEFISVGEFYDGTPDDYRLGRRTPRNYRNPLLVTAMQEVHLIDRLGYGIHRMVRDQVRRFLPLPDYDLSTPTEVQLTIPGAVIDKSYSELLMVRTDLPLEDIAALDRVQKGLPISPEAAKHLRDKKLIEGRRPNLRVSSTVAEATDEMAAYIRTRPQADTHYATLLTDYLKAQGHASRSDVNDLLLPVLSEVLDDKQKAAKIANLLTKLRRQGVIINRGSRAKPRWELLSASDIQEDS